MSSLLAFPITVHSNYEVGRQLACHPDILPPDLDVEVLDHSAADEAWELAYRLGLDGEGIVAGPAPGRSDSVRLALMAGHAAGLAERDYRFELVAEGLARGEAMAWMFADDERYMNDNLPLGVTD